ncbi:MAG: hypothetical protein KatS3mg023_0936 [Armatimonadota bacterium]|nr:MAG: hypothetical protein KatS3mg023_0936 [Armatimonadota bacterium]
MRTVFLLALFVLGSLIALDARAQLTFSNTYQKWDSTIYLKTVPYWGVVVIHYVPKSEEAKRKLQWFYNTVRSLSAKHSPRTLGFLSMSRVRLIGNEFDDDNPFEELAQVSDITLSSGQTVRIDWWNGSPVSLPAGKPKAVTLVLGLKSGETWRWHHPEDVMVHLFVGQSIGDVLDDPIRPTYRIAERNVTTYVRVEDDKLQVYVFPHNLLGLDTLEKLRKDLGMSIVFLTQTGFTAHSVHIYPHDWVKLYSEKPEYIHGLKYETRIFPDEPFVDVKLGWLSFKRR